MELNNNVYTIQGLKLTDIAEQFGTPVYVYDADKIAGQVQKLKDGFKGLNVKLKYAAKALTNLSILKLIRKQGCGLDVVSIQEAHLGIRAGFKPSEILFTPNSVAFSEIREAVELGLQINIDNISILEQFGNEYGGTKSCCIRLNPHIMAGGNNKISTGHIDSKFGISVYQMRHIERIVKACNMRINGLHVHTGSDILDPEVFLRGAEIIFESATHFPDLEFIDFGSGFKVAYKDDDITTDLQELGKKLGSAFKAFCKEYGRKLELWFEPGKFIVSESGYFLVRANTLKTTPATVFVGVDSGQNHLIRPMMYGAHHEIVNVSNTSGTKRVYTIVGYICETDTFGWDRQMHEVREGDILAIKNAGAYGFSMASNYNSRLRPAEVMVYKGEAKLIRQRETLDDLLRNQVEIEL
ncbi:diaminopimelate decarboxylase [Fulvitalea axinellae]|uniref:Diaminopimelate decarboxylase n=1 Tax=Fulvitalea axinellae TaxID=1182444 RepID=A0AAU9C6T1_9BACT|nr:diaminopimelate decarboxylase [Fulvitalea axinellae]